MPPRKPRQRKLGLAMSGGGFRASLFHIGVLAKLAELDLLRPVEVISCVSGGSIIGALYYQHVKRLLELKPDARITRQDYIEIVQKMEVEFLKGVMSNIRVRAFSNFWKNWKMMRRDYSRSDRMAELYDGEFYDKVAAHPRIALGELKIQPPGSPPKFHPRRHNKARRAKVPMLILNATTLNTGRNWQFTAVDMGERRPDDETQSFDKNLVLDPLAYDFIREEGQEFPAEKYRQVPLSVAVAASACVPGIFTPLPLTDLYPDMTPQLVDGGVQDNQGLASILFEQCTDVVTSDASGQLKDVSNPAMGIFNVLSRTNSILMDRVRDQGLRSLFLCEGAKVVRYHPIMHLRVEVDQQYLSPGEPQSEIGQIIEGKTSFGIQKEVQRRLSEIRTDLDTFTEVEAYSLMYSGYAMTGKMIGRELSGAYGARARATEAEWPFKEVKGFAEGKRKSDEYLRQLSVGKQTLLKVYHLVPALAPLGLLIMLIGIGGPLFGVLVGWQFICDMLNIHWWVLRAVVLLPILAVGIAGMISLVSFMHLKVIDPFFLRRGSLRSLRAKSP